MMNTETKTETNLTSLKLPCRHPWLRTLSLVLATLLLFLATAILALALPDTYSETFLGELADKYELLRDTNEPKIVVIGGSSVAFGLDSEMLSEYTGYKVVNFGLYATLGTKLMLDLSKVNINEGDIVVIAPELDAQTLSMYFNAEAAWQGIGSDFSMLRYVGDDNISDLMGGLYDYIAAKASYLTKGITLSPTGVYRHDSFNEYGDISYARAYNVMTAGYDVNNVISLTSDLFDEEFLDYLNHYIKWVQSKGATAYFSLCPINKSALASDMTDEAILAFYRYLTESVICDVISGFDTAIMEENYFYDTNFHLNDAGVTVHTAALVNDINRALGKDTPEIKLPAAPERPTPSGAENWVENEWSDCFLYEPYGDGLAIVGVADKAKDMERLVLPYKANGKAVYVISANAFAGCDALTEITLYDNFSLFEDGAFDGAPNLVRLRFLRDIAENLEASTHLFDAVREDLKIYLYTETGYTNFATGYWWAFYVDRLVYVK